MSEGAGSQGIPTARVQNTVGDPITDQRTRLAKLAADLQSALTHHQAGRLEEAESLYCKLLDAVPGYPRVLHLLGVVKTRRGQPEAGVELIGRALPALARVPEAHVDFGNALRLAGRREEAAEGYRRAIALKPDHVLAHNCLGGVLGELGRFEAAVTHCQAAIAIDPKSLPARITLAAVLQGARRLPEAAQTWREIIALQPHRPESYHQLSAQLVALGLQCAPLFADQAMARARRPAFAMLSRSLRMLRVCSALF